MLLKLQTPLKDQTGQPLVKEKETLTVGLALSEALMSSQANPQVPAAEIVFTYNLAQSLRARECIEVGVKELALLEQCAKNFPLLISGQLLVILEEIQNGEGNNTDGR